jgi:uncharacterized membrane protein YhfC
MKPNMGTIDRVLRVLVAIVIGVLYFTNQINGTAATVLGLFAVVFVVTSLLGSCPLYSPLNITTKKDQQ